MSNLLSQASLVMIPSGYKEDIVYSQIPTNGNGDLTFTRASNGTRINSAGLVEVAPWNLATDSENFSANYLEINSTISSNTTTAPNGTTTAESLLETTATDVHAIRGDYTETSGIAYTYSVYAKTISGRNIQVLGSNGFTGPIARVNLSNGTLLSGSTGASVQSVGNGWYRISITETTTTTSIRTIIYSMDGTATTFAGSTSNGVYIWGAQLNIGSTAKPYFPTTDRLNVPRLTYQNGGGGCPSLLLEKQSTNIIPYSETFENWTTGFSALSPNAVTANYGISPDGTQNADRIQLTINASNTVSQIYQFPSSSTTTYTASVWLKSLSGTPTIAIVDSYNITGGYQLVTLTTEWVRHTVTFAASSGGIIPQFLLLYGTTSNSADFLAWGFQLEASSYATTYIPTTSSSATRVADECFKTGISSLIGQTEGTLFCQFNKPVDLVGNLRLNVSDGSFSNWVFVGFAGTSLRAYLRANNTVIETQTFSTTANINKIAIAYKSGNYAIYHNGTQISSGTTVYSFSATLSQLNFGETPTDFNIYPIAQIAQFELFKTRLTNAELASLTTL